MILAVALGALAMAIYAMARIETYLHGRRLRLRSLASVATNLAEKRKAGVDAPGLPKPVRRRSTTRTPKK